MEHPHAGILQVRPAPRRSPGPARDRARGPSSSPREAPVGPRPQHACRPLGVLGGGEHQPRFSRSSRAGARPAGAACLPARPRPGAAARPSAAPSPRPAATLDRAPRARAAAERAVHEGQFSAHQLGAEHLGRILQRRGDRVDEAAVRVRPPTARTAPADLGHQRSRPACRRQRQDALAAQEVERVCAVRRQGRIVADRESPCIGLRRERARCICGASEVPR